MLALSLIAAAVLYLLAGEAITVFLVIVLPAKFTGRGGSFVWYWHSLRVTAWPLIVIGAAFYALSIPARLVYERFKKPALRKVEAA